MRTIQFHFVLIASLATLTAGDIKARAVTYKILYSFQGGSKGAGPGAGVTIGESGVLYGTTRHGGPSRVGTIFKLTPEGNSWSESVIYAFSGPDGAFPLTAGLVFGGSQVLYGTTEAGGEAAGTAFKLTPSNTGQWTQTVLWEPPVAGQSLLYGVLIGPEGTLYTPEDSGTAVALTPPNAPGGNWTATVIASVAGTPGAGFVSDGCALYGTSFSGGTINCQDGWWCGGAAYELTPPAVPAGSWVTAILHEFGATPGDGGGPNGLTVGPSGVLYGETYWGGAGTLCEIQGYGFSGCGTVFQLTPPAAPGTVWTESVLYNFTGEDGDGAFPIGAVVVGQNGALYGTTEFGGSAASCGYFGATGCGTVFQLTPPTVAGGAWAESVLHSFSGVNGDGSSPAAVLAIGSSGVLYGTTSEGGSAGLGTVFSIVP
jgi:uncharacterized repeat protein (TIGR03803 family)